jgi:putative membrane protein
MYHSKIISRNFIKYKFLNSLFLGLSVGSIFTIYTGISPSIYSLGGVLLAISMLFIAKIYKKILNINYFYKISLVVEFILFFAIVYFLLFSYSYATALLMYIGYQITFIFGSYLVRAETLFLKKTALLSFIDVAKQTGYLIGMLLSFLFYKYLDFININDSQIQVTYIHYLLIVLEVVIISMLFKSFKIKK